LRPFRIKTERPFFGGANFHGVCVLSVDIDVAFSQAHLETAAMASTYDLL
jgi:hypothetical protein